jgi:hypothetical protein
MAENLFVGTGDYKRGVGHGGCCRARSLFGRRIAIKISGDQAS